MSLSISNYKIYSATLNDFRSVQSLSMSSLKAVEKKQKQVFKPLLDNPFPSSQFPIIEQTTQQQIFDFLQLLLKDIGNYKEANPGIKNVKKPEILNHTTLGFNSTVQLLEQQVRNKVPVSDPIKYVFVCKPDIQPPLLIQHFPNLCYMAGRKSKNVKLIQLPRGSVIKFEQVTGQKLNIIGLKESVERVASKSFLELLDNDSKVPKLEIEWLHDLKFQKAKVNLVKTTAPIIPKVGKNKVSKLQTNASKSKK